VRHDDHRVIRLRPLALVATVVAMVALAGPAAAPAAVPAPQPLGTGWSYRDDPADLGGAQGWGPRPPAAGWRPARVPSVMDDGLTAADFHGQVGWYRATFTGPTAARGFDWALRFGAVRRQAQVWLNGVPIGRHDDPYVPFALPARGLREGAQNTLVVRVDSRKGREPREGWWNWGGITRPVQLVPRGGLELRDPGFLSRVSCPRSAGCTAALLLDTVVVNRSAAPQGDPVLSVRLRPPGGGRAIEARRAVRPLAPGEEAHVRMRVPVPDARLWSPDDPALYAATATLSAGGAAQQVERRKVGLRSVRVVDGMLRLNGRQLDLRGASIQEDVPGHGAALTDADVREIVAGLQAVHANVTRAHYLLDERLLGALDAAGIMVWSQAPIYHRDRQLETAAQRARALATLRGTVLAARSHPAVITHSVGNELSAVPDTVPGTRAYLAAARATVAGLDPTVPPSVDLLSYPGYRRQRAYAAFPLLGINSYFGWYPGKKAHPTGRLADLGPFLDRTRRMYQGAALVVTEFGAESTFAGPASEKETYAFQDGYIRDVLHQLGRRPWVGGAIYWTLREFAVKPAWDGGAARPVRRDAIHNKGLISYAGVRKPAWAIAARDFAGTPLYQSVSPSLAAGLPQGSGSGSPVVLLFVAGLVVVGLVVDLWAVAGILDLRLPARRPAPAPAPELNARSAPAPR
jgi:hypothetical protein